MKTGKRILSIILAVLMVVLAVPAGFLTGIVLFPKAHAYNAGDHIQFGTYPQTQVAETTALKNAANKATWKSYGYYTGAGTLRDCNLTSSDYMQFSDFFFEGKKYRAVKFSKYRPSYTYGQSNERTSLQDNNGFSLNTIYYFKYEPLSWRVLDPKTGYIMCESIVDSQAFQNTAYYSGYSNGNVYYQTSSFSEYANNYASSTIRSWLNDDFYKTAFNQEQMAEIKSTDLNNDAPHSDWEMFNAAPTRDKVFLLSFSDATNNAFDFVPVETAYDSNFDENRTAQGTDYAKCQGLDLFHSVAGNSRWENNGLWWLRTPSYASGFACYVYYKGEAEATRVDSTIIFDTGFGIRPACCLSTLKNDATVSTELFSKDNSSIIIHANESISAPSAPKASAIKTNALRLKWTSVSGAKGYVVYRYNPSTDGYTKIGTTTKTVFIAKNLKAGTTYCFAVKAYKTVKGANYYSNYSKRLTTVTKPIAPTIKVTAGTKQATVKWKAVKGATSYVVYRGTDEDGSFKKIGTTETTVFKAKKLKSDEFYYFKVVAIATVNGTTVKSAASQPVGAWIG